MSLDSFVEFKLLKAGIHYHFVGLVWKLSGTTPLDKKARDTKIRIEIIIWSLPVNTEK